MNAATPNLSAVLGQVATIVKIKSTSLGMNRLDKTASKQSDRSHNAKEGTGKTYASRLSGAEDFVKNIESKKAEIVAELKAITTAYNDDRLLANSLMQQWLSTWGTKKGEYDALVDDFKAKAPQLIANANVNKGTYNVDVPTLREVEEAFSIEFVMTQIPDSTTYTSNLDAAMNRELRRRFEQGVEAAYHNAQKDALKRVAAPLSNMIDRLTVYSVTEEEKARGSVSSSARLYETVITNVQDIAKVFRSFNLTGDAVMDDIATKLDAFDGIDIEDLKSSKALRDDMTKRAAVIMDELKDLI